MNASPRQIECTIPVLPVGDLARAFRFYTGTLGFTADWGDHAGSEIGSVSRDGCRLMLRQSPPPSSPVWVWIGLEDDRLFHEYRAAGVAVRQEPQNFSWAYEMKFEDPDRNILWLGTEPRPDLPFEDSEA